MKKLEKKSIVMVVVCLMAGMASAGTIFTDGFNLEDGYVNDAPLSYGWTSAYGEALPLIDGTPGRAPEGSACATVSSNGGSRAGYIDFNLNPVVGASTVTVDYYTYAGAFASPGSFILGLMDAGTENVQAAVYFTSGKINIYSTAGGVVESDFAYVVNTANWYHVALEMDYTASTAKVYAKAVTSGDTTPLIAADMVSFGGSDTVAISPSSPYASRLYMYGSNTFQLVDNVVVTEVPEPATMTLLTSGLIGFVIRKRK